MKLTTKLDKNSKYTKAKIVKKIVKKKGNSLNKVGTANSVSINISCVGWIKILLSVKKPEPNPIKMSLVKNPKYIEKIAKTTKGSIKKISPSWLIFLLFKG